MATWPAFIGVGAVMGALPPGAAPASALTAFWAQRIDASRVQAAFGWFLIASGAAFAVYRLTV